MVFAVHAQKEHISLHHCRLKKPHVSIVQQAALVRFSRVLSAKLAHQGILQKLLEMSSVSSVHEARLQKEVERLFAPIAHLANMLPTRAPHYALCVQEACMPQSQAQSIVHNVAQERVLKKLGRIIKAIACVLWPPMDLVEHLIMLHARSVRKGCSVMSWA
jgi:hypothetical protein